MSVQQKSNSPIQSSDSDRLLDIFGRANEIASMNSLDDLLVQMLDLLLDVAGAETGTLYLHDLETKELVFHVIEGGTAQNLVGRRIKQDEGIVGTAFMETRHILVEDLQKDPRWLNMGASLKNTLAVPLMVGGQPIGVVQVFNFAQPEIELIMLLANRMASEVDKLALVTASQQYTKRLETLFEVVRGLGSTLDREQLLHHIVVQGRTLLEAEACSIFLIDEETGDVELYAASQDSDEQKLEISVPKSKGIVGEVIRTGEPMVVPDVSESPYHFAEADKQTKFVTRDILAVPLKSTPIHLGENLGSTPEQTLGVIEALNKISSPFNQRDLEILESLAVQAATVLRIAELYHDANELFLNLVEALSTTIDAKDPYTRNHSKRVAEIALRVGKELDLSPEMLNHYYIGGMLHDLGKIVIPINVLNKPGRLSDEEYALIKEHPKVGQKILQSVEKLQIETQALAEHHEHFDGTGYPNGLKGEQISLIGRVVAVADLYDSLTTDRPYRKAMTSQEAIDFLIENSGSRYDPNCVQAMVSLEGRGDLNFDGDLSA